MIQQYRKMDVSTASPEMLVLKLLDRALFHLRSVVDGETQPSTEDRCRALGKALAIVSELRNVLDLERGGEIAANLDALYEFVGARLIAANQAGTTEPVREAQRVLEPLAEGWRGISGAQPQGQVSAA